MGFDLEASIYKYRSDLRKVQLGFGVSYMLLHIEGIPFMVVVSDAATRLLHFTYIVVHTVGRPSGNRFLFH